MLSTHVYSQDNAPRKRKEKKINTSNTMLKIDLTFHNLPKMVLETSCEMPEM